MQIHETQARYLEAKAAVANAYSAMPNDADVPDDTWEAFEEAERNLREAQYQMCKWGVEVAQSLPWCTDKQRDLLKAMWASAARHPVTFNKLADIVIQLDASTI